uniref:P-type ATPase A domain-containing protein n=1 Tax=Gouania willdenowi TaxID=441366 RepID=A0A8C5DUM5_GOUWI
MIGLLNIERRPELQAAVRGFSEFRGKTLMEIFVCTGLKLLSVLYIYTSVVNLPFLSLYFRLQVLNPFYVFQVFSVILWMCDNYYLYASIIVVISFISIGGFLFLCFLIKFSVVADVLSVLCVFPAEDCVSSDELVPGDCLLIPQEGLLLPCDAVLLTGECLVNESMLTGESVPVLKTTLPVGEKKYCPETERRHTLFCGTQLIQAKGGGEDGCGAVAVVTSTGFFTAKGHLISSILYPQPINFRFYKDAFKFLFILGFFAFIGSIYIFVVLYKAKVSLKTLIIRSLDIVTIAVPPALPAAITTGTIYAQNRLKRKEIFCISPPRINVGGKVSLFCFDKTGTLTEEGLDVWGVMQGGPAGFSDLVPDPSRLPPGPLLSGLACCHSVTLLRGHALGDPLELKMIDSTGWEPDGDSRTLDEEFGISKVLAVMRPPSHCHHSQGASSSEAVAILQRFPFSSALQRMSVVTVSCGGRAAFAFIKGAPETVAGLCRPETVPPQFSSQLRHFSSEGLRVLAVAYKPLDVNSVCLSVLREEVEEDMQFLGLLMMKNLVKQESPKVMDILRVASIRSVMVTGDNILTAVNVAKSCRMLGAEEKVIFVIATPHTAESRPTLRFIIMFLSSQHQYQGASGYHLAISGKSFAALCDHFPEDVPKVLMRATVFARMTPEQKTQLVKELQNMNYRVGMCGDGANDCGALRAADVGISLSEAEASVASPFTSKTQNISCVPLLIREGRCSLVTSSSLFRYMALYSVVQFCSVIILCTVKTSPGDLQFVLWDLLLVTLLALVMGLGGPSEELQPSRPSASLLTLPVLGSLFIHSCVIAVGQIAALLLTFSQSWFVPLNSTVFGTENLPNMEDTSVFDLSGFQYIIMAVVVTKGYPHKKPIYHNWIFLGLVIIQFAVMVWLVLYPGSFFSHYLQLYNFSDMNFKLLLVAMAMLNFFICFDVEVSEVRLPPKRTSILRVCVSSTVCDLLAIFSHQSVSAHCLRGE